MAFRRLLLPVAVNLTWISDPMFSTRIVRTDSGKEFRNIEWDGTLGRARLSYDARRQDVWAEIDKFYQAVHGMGYSFLVRDPRKYTATAAEGKFVDGQAVLRITAGAYAIDKVITKLDAGVIVTGGTVDIWTGISADGATSWAGIFYLCMRFDGELEVSGVNRSVHDGTLIAAYKDVPLIEVSDEEEDA